MISFVDFINSVVAGGLHSTAGNTQKMIALK